MAPRHYGIGVTYRPPPSGSEYLPRFPNGFYVQDYDTRNPNGGYGSIYKTPATAGTYQVDFQTHFDYTNCYIQPNASELISTFFHALTCKPNFRFNGAGTIDRLRIPTAPNKVRVFLDPVTLSALEPALDDVITDWNGRLAGTGLQFERVSSPCGGGPDCISVVTVSPATQTACGFSHANWHLTTGEMMSDGELRIRTDWSSYSPDGRKRTFAHELGHFAGMWNSDSTACTASQAMMQDQFDCLASGNAFTTTVNDYLPVNNTVYGGRTYVSCGF